METKIVGGNEIKQVSKLESDVAKDQTCLRELLDCELVVVGGGSGDVVLG